MPTEDALIQALKLVDKVGDIADADLSGPRQVAMSETVLRKGMARWSPDVGRFVLTATGRARLVARPRSGPSTVLAFPSDRVPRKAAHKS